MFWDDEKLLVYFDEEAHIVRRLGAAVVSLWAELDPAVRDRLIARASRMLDDDETVLEPQAIASFLRTHEKPVTARALRTPREEAGRGRAAISRPS